MIQITAQTRILVAVEAVDFRKGIDGLARVCQERLQSDPFGGWLFIFRNRRQTSLKILTYDLCEVPNYVELMYRCGVASAVSRTQLHIIGW